MQQNLIQNLTCPTFSLQANTWVEVAPGGATPAARSSHHSVIDAAGGRIYFYGGDGGERAKLAQLMDM